MPETPADPHPLRSGDPRAFDRLYDQFAPRVLGYLLRLTGGSRAEAEDLVQETFLAAYAGRGGFVGRSQPLAWLLGIARRRWRDGKRGKAPESASLTEEAGEHVPSVGEGVAEQVTRAATLERALARLNIEQREAVTLVVIEGLTYKEAAAITGEPIGTVKWRVHEATRNLRRLLAGAYEEYGCEPEATRTTAKADPAASRG